MMDGYLSTSATAARLKVSRQRVQFLVSDKGGQVLKGELCGNSYMITIASIEAYEATERAAGRPTRKDEPK